MEWLGDILGAVTNVASGGIFGLIGSLVGVGAKWLQERQRQAWERAKWEREERMLRLKMEAASQRTAQELEIVAQRGSWQGLSESLASDARRAESAPSWVNAIRSLFRPVLTVILLGMVGMLWLDLYGSLARVQSGDPDNLLVIFTEVEIQERLRYIMDTVVFTASAAAMWWFGERAMTPAGAKSR